MFNLRAWVLLGVTLIPSTHLYASLSKSENENNIKIKKEYFIRPSKGVVYDFSHDLFPCLKKDSQTAKRRPSSLLKEEPLSSKKHNGFSVFELTREVLDFSDTYASPDSVIDSLKWIPAPIEEAGRNFLEEENSYTETKEKIEKLKERRENLFQVFSDNLSHIQFNKCLLSIDALTEEGKGKLKKFFSLEKEQFYKDLSFLNKNNYFFEIKSFIQLFHQLSTKDQNEIETELLKGSMPWLRSPEIHAFIEKEKIEIENEQRKIAQKAKKHGLQWE